MIDQAPSRRFDNIVFGNPKMKYNLTHQHGLINAFLLLNIITYLILTYK